MAIEANTTTIKILEQSHVSPPPGLVPPTKLPLTFLDFPWLVSGPIQCLFFYHLPQPTHHFSLSILPHLKHSLSLSLRHFFPLAANLLLPPPPHKPYLFYADGEGSVSLTVAESSYDFNHLVSNDHPRDVKELHPFVPELPGTTSRSSEEGITYVVPILALQVTIFPNFGICIGATYSHVAADGRAIAHFMKSWASICTNMCENKLTLFDTLEELAPKHADDRDAIKDPYDLVSVFHEYYSARAWNNIKNGTASTDLARLEGKVRATFVLTKSHLGMIKSRVSKQFITGEDTQALHASTFVVTCAFFWAHIIKSQAAIHTSESEEVRYLFFLVDCRDRKGSEFPVPATYFGNCLGFCVVEMNLSELVGENGVFAAAKAIATRIKELENGTMRGVSTWMSDRKRVFGSKNALSIAGSPNLGAYGLDFGWGRPHKCEMVHIDVSGAISMGESRQELEGGLEIGVALNKDKMDKFALLFEQGLESFMK